LASLGLLERAETELRAMIVTAERLGMHNTVAAARANLGLVLLYRGELEQARAVEEQAVAALAAMGDRPLEAAGRAYLAGILLGRGDLEGAEAEASRGVLPETVGPLRRACALATLAQVLLVRERIDDALRAAQEAMDILTRLGSIDEGESLIRL